MTTLSGRAERMNLDVGLIATENLRRGHHKFLFCAIKQNKTRNFALVGAKQIPLYDVSKKLTLRHARPASEKRASCISSTKLAYPYHLDPFFAPVLRLPPTAAQLHRQFQNQCLPGWTP